VGPAHERQPRRPIRGASGIITEVQTNGITLLTREGVIRLELRVTGLKPDEVKRYENALVRVRGVLLATWITRPTR